MANLFPIVFPFNEDSPEMKKLGIQTEYEVYKKIGNIYDENVDVVYGQDFLKRNYDGSLEKGEITDFLIIHPKKGILFLECKGGLMEYDGNRITNHLKKVMTPLNKRRMVNILL